MFDPINGGFAVLAGTLGETGNGVRLDVTVVDVKSATPSTVLKDEDLEVTAMGVPHTNAPSASYRVRVGEHSIVFSGNQTGLAGFRARRIQSLQSRSERG
jgi:hypothetical protein